MVLGLWIPHTVGSLVSQDTCWGLLQVGAAIVIPNVLSSVRGGWRPWSGPGETEPLPSRVEGPSFRPTVRSALQKSIPMCLLFITMTAVEPQGCSVRQVGKADRSDMCRADRSGDTLRFWGEMRWSTDLERYFRPCHS